MITNARIPNDLAVLPGVGWVTCLRARSIHELRDQGAIQLGFFDTQDLAEITSEGNPCELLVVYRKPLLALERQRKRQELLAATEDDLAEIAARVRRSRRPLRGAVEIGRAVERALSFHNRRLQSAACRFQVESQKSGRVHSDRSRKGLPPVA